MLRKLAGPLFALAIVLFLIGKFHGGIISGGKSPSSISVPGNPKGNVALGYQLAASYGWNRQPQWGCLYTLWDHESGWVIQWNHQGSGAYGIPQALPASKMASAGADYMTNPATQIKWGLGYIKTRYGTPCGAWGQYCSHPAPNRCWY